jgi:hypothetical protein
MIKYQTKKIFSVTSLFVLIVITSFLLFLAYNKYKEDKEVSWDGFVYLVHSYSTITGKKLFLDRIRSPLVVLVKPPNMENARN